MKLGNSHKIFAAKDGSAAIEFALIAPVMLLFAIGTVEMSLMMMAQNIMESATFSASRIGKTGYVATGKTREDTIMDELASKSAGLIDTRKITIQTLAYDTFSDVGKPEPFVDANNNGVRDNGENFTDVNGNGVYDSDMGASSSGNAGQVVVYEVTYPWKIATPIMSSFIGTNGIFTLTAHAVVKNEPF